MKALVTGATGLLGRHLVNRLLQEGVTVRAMIEPGSGNPWPRAGEVEVVEVDVRNREDVMAAVSGMHTVYHLAALTQCGPQDVDELFEVNVDGTDHIAHACLEHGVRRLVHASSVAIHGRRIRCHGICEDTPPRPDSPYSESKLRAERLLRSHHAASGLPVVIVRTSNVFGAGAEGWRDIFRRLASGRMRLIGRGNGLMALTSTADITQGLWLCGTVAGIEGHSYIITSGRSISLKDWLDVVCTEVGGSLMTPALPAAPLRLYDRLNSAWYAATGRELPRADRISLFLGDRSFDISRARRELGFEPQSSPAEMARETATWYRSMGWLGEKP